jgi:hypoxanthine-DNA glycosylase
MPGEASLRADQYYAHPQNLFWRILGEILGYPLDSSAQRPDVEDSRGGRANTLRDAPYAEKLRVLRSAHIALWDVLASCQRKGSLDSDIVRETLQANDFAAFFACHRRIERVLFNGAKAQECFRKYVAPSLDMRAIECVSLPSTSPANASISYASKLAAWRVGLDA